MSSVFKDRLIQAMEVRNVKAVELAEKTGLSKARISQYMNGVYVPKSKGTHLIAKALQVEETWLMGITDNMERTERNSLLNQEGGSEKIMTVLKRRKDLLACVNLLVENESEINENDVEKTMTMIETFFLDKKDKE